MSDVAPAKRARRIPGSVEERFWRFVSPEPNSGCWLWCGSTDKKGYGQLRIRQRGAGALAYATHVSLRLHGRPIRDGMQACHHCDVPACVNPDHLFIGTQLDNIHDAMAKGRHVPPPNMLGIKRGHHLRTNCQNGHELSNDNVYVRPDGVRVCRACRMEHKRRMRRRLAAAGLTSRGTPRTMP